MHPFDDDILDIQCDKTYTVVRTDNEISVFSIEEWIELEAILKQFSDSYREYKAMSDDELVRLNFTIDFTKYKNALFYLRTIGYPMDLYDECVVEEKTGEGFLQYLYTETSINTYIYVNKFRKHVCRCIQDLRTYSKFLNEIDI